MKKASILLCVLISVITGCHNNNSNDEWKQAYEEKKFEAEMTVKAKDFIKWYIGKLFHLFYAYRSVFWVMD